MPQVTKASEALKLALKVMALPEAPWSLYTSRGHHAFTCNALDYLTEAEEIADGVQDRALDALWLNSDRYRQGREKVGVWFNFLTPEELGQREHVNTAPHLRRIAAINKTIAELEAKGD